MIAEKCIVIAEKKKREEAQGRKVLFLIISFLAENVSLIRIAVPITYAVPIKVLPVSRLRDFFENSIGKAL